MNSRGDGLNIVVYRRGQQPSLLVVAVGWKIDEPSFSQHFRSRKVLER